MSERAAPSAKLLALLAVPVVVLAAVLFALASSGGDDGANTTVPERGEGGGRITERAFVRFDGTEGRLDDYEGRPLVVNFFASWCRPCVSEMPVFERVHQRYGDRVAFLGFDVRDTLEEGRSIARRTGVTYDLARDPQGAFLEAFDGIVMPTTALVSSEGRVVEVHNGELGRSELEELIRENLFR